MSKKKLVSLCLVVALVLTAAIGGTMAYFTDQDQVKNVFAIGNLDIELTENVDVQDKDGESVEGLVEETNDGASYTGLMPSYKIVKEPVVTNTGANDAYVRVFITMNNYVAINDALDEVYEKQGEETIQGVYNNVFDGWGIQHNKGVVGKHVLRGWMSKTIDGKLLYVDYVRCPADKYQYDPSNTFQSDEEIAAGTYAQLFTENGYYNDALDNNARTYILYLKLAPGESYTLFNGLNVPDDFNAAQAAMFENLKINVYADAIQTVGFDTAIDAFNALEDEHHLGWWN